MAWTSVCSAASLGSNSGYLSRLLQSLTTQGLIAVAKGAGDGRRRRVSLTRKGSAERAAYDTLSDQLAASMLAPLDASQHGRLLTAMGEVERLIRAASVEVAAEAPDSADARRCLDAYFRELKARFEGGFDADADNSARAEAMTPPAGLFVVARLDGEAVGCGGLQAHRQDDRGNQAGVDRAVGPRHGRRAPDASNARGRRPRRGLKRLRLDTNRALTEAHALYRNEGYREIARFNDNPYADHWFEKQL